MIEPENPQRQNSIDSRRYFLVIDSDQRSRMLSLLKALFQMHHRSQVIDRPFLKTPHQHALQQTPIPHTCRFTR